MNKLIIAFLLILELFIPHQLSAATHEDQDSALNIFCLLSEILPPGVLITKREAAPSLREQFVQFRGRVAKLPVRQEVELFLLVFMTRPDLDGELGYLFAGMFSECDERLIRSLRAVTNKQLRVDGRFSTDDIERFRRFTDVIADWIEKQKECQKKPVL